MDTMSKDAKLIAKQEFERRDAALIGAVNGLGRPVGTQDELVELRRALMQARHECEVLGVNVETVWERVQKRRKEEEENVRRYAEEQTNVTPMISAKSRREVAMGAGLVVAVAVLLQWPELGGVLAAMVSGMFVYTLVESVIAEHFPTPAIRVARMACERDVDVSDLWTKGSLAHKDYVYAYSRHQMRLSLQGNSRSYIKAR